MTARRGYSSAAGPPDDCHVAGATSPVEHPPGSPPERSVGNSPQVASTKMDA
jgi:hypothetical protein